MLKLEHCIVPDWPAPANVRTLITTRNGGVSGNPYRNLNLGDHVGDEAQAVAENRRRLRSCLPNDPLWLRQRHGTTVATADELGRSGNRLANPFADACVARRALAVCAVLTADCLPILLCDRTGGCVGAVHAGWRGLAAGIVEAAVRAMAVAPAMLIAYLGPAIGPAAFEVGDDVLRAFAARDAAAARAFVAWQNGKWLADIYALARMRLAGCGVTASYGGDFCTVGDERFFSHRRDKITGRFASLIWLAEN